METMTKILRFYFKSIFLFSILILFSQEAWVSKVYNTPVKLEVLVDQSRFVLKIEKISAVEDVVVRINSEKSEKLHVQKVKILEVLKNDESDQIWGTPLQFAARYGNKLQIELLIKNGASLLAPNVQGNFVIHDLIESHFTENLPQILKLTADPNIKNKNGSTPLHLAVQSRASTETIKLLVESGADPNINDLQGKSAVQLAKSLGNPDIINALTHTKPHE
jgi:uncharacterized protein